MMRRIPLALMFGIIWTLAGCDGNSAGSATPEGLGDTISSITPTADGGAYVVGSGTIWYLRGGEAIKVKEVLSLSTKPIKLSTREAGLFALWQSERANPRTWIAEQERAQDMEAQAAEHDY